MAFQAQHDAPAVIAGVAHHPPKRRIAFLALALLAPWTRQAIADVLPVPSALYPTVTAAQAAAAAGDTIEIQPGLRLEPSPALFGGAKALRLVPASGRVILALDQPPANDDYASAVELAGAPLLAQGANYAATTGAWDDLSARLAALHVGRTVWWRWTAPANGLVVASTLGSDFLAVLDVFLATGPGPAVLPLEWGRPNEVAFRAEAGEDYAFLAGGDRADYGQITFQLRYVEPPPNDALTNAVVIPEDGGVVSGTSEGATSETPWEPDHAGSAADHSVWFAWTAPLTNAVATLPVKLSTAGSDFDTALAVYTNLPAGGLGLVASNDNRVVNSTDSRLAFTAVPGVDYRIAVDGGAYALDPRDRFGNYLFRLDPSLVDLRLATNAPVVDVQTRRATFEGQVDVRNRGQVGTAPLQLRFVARAAQDLPGIHRAPAAQTNLLTLDVPRGLGPNESFGSFYRVECPAPMPVDGRTNFWGVFALLEEEFGGGQVVIDFDFLGYGDLAGEAPPILSWGPGRPLPPRLASSEVNNVGPSRLQGPPWATENSTNQFFFHVQLFSGETKAQTNGAWSVTPLPPGVTIGANGELRVGELTHSTRLTLSGSFALGGRSFRPSPEAEPVSLYRRPQLTATALPDPGFVQLEITDDSGLVFALEAKPTLPATNWQTLHQVIVTNPAAPLLLTAPMGPDRETFFRLRASP